MKVKLLKMLSYGWTNVLFLGLLNFKKVIVKAFYFNPRTFLLLAVYVLASFLRLEIPPALPILPKSRIRNEMKANNVLMSLGIKVPRTLSSDEFVIFDIIDGLNMGEFLKIDQNIKTMRRIAYSKGVELAKVHNKGFAFIDNKAENTIITKDLELYSIDHEFFCFEAKEFQRELDFITLAATLPSEKYEEFWKSFCLGYKKVRRKIPKIERKDILGLSMIGFGLMRLIGFY